MLHNIKSEIPARPILTENLKQAIANFLYYWNGRYSIILCRDNPPTENNQYEGKWNNIYYQAPDGYHEQLNFAEPDWLIEYAVGTTTFDWNDISIVNTAVDMENLEYKEYTRHA